MEFTELIQKRYSCRAYSDRPVEEGTLQKVLQAAIIAPTGANRQPFRIYVIQTKDRNKELGKIYGRDWFTQAPMVLCICAVPEQAWVRKHSDGKNIAEIDTAIAMDHLILAAANEGLGTCWIAAFDPDAARNVLNLPDGHIPLAFTPLGYPTDAWAPKKRKTMEELVTLIV